MQSNYAMPLVSCDQFKTVAIIDVINKLERLTQIKNSILSNVSDKITQRIGRLQNIKSRLVRLKEMIRIVSMQSKTITIKSKRNYPNKKYEIPNTVLSGEELDMNILRNINSMNFNSTINTKTVYADPVNNRVENVEGKSYLREAPAGSIDEAIKMQIILNECLKKYSEITKSIFEARIKASTASTINNDSHFEIDQNDKNSIYTLTNFNIINKKMINANIKKIIEGDLVKIAETEAMIAFNKKMQERAEKNNKKRAQNIQEAPVSIAAGQKLDEFSNKINLNLKNEQPNFEIEAPEELNLGNVALIEREQEETASAGQNEVVEEKNNNDYDDIFNKEEGVEIEYEDEPVDWMKDKLERNKNKANNTPEQPESQQTTPTAQAPSAPSPPPTTSTVGVSVGAGPGVPPPPPLPPILPKKVNPPPKVQAPKIEVKKEVPKEEAKEEAKEDQKEGEEDKKDGEGEENKEPVKELSMEEQLKLAMSGLKKVGEQKIEDKVAPKQMSMEEQIYAARNKLKKVGEVKKDEAPPQDSNKGLNLVRIFF